MIYTITFTRHCRNFFHNTLQLSKVEQWTLLVYSPWLSVLSEEDTFQCQLRYLIYYVHLVSNFVNFFLDDFPSVITMSLFGTYFRSLLFSVNGERRKRLRALCVFVLPQLYLIFSIDFFIVFWSKNLFKWNSLRACLLDVNTTTRTLSLPIYQEWTMLFTNVLTILNLSIAILPNSSSKNMMPVEPSYRLEKGRKFVLRYWLINVKFYRVSQLFAYLIKYSSLIKINAPFQTEMDKKLQSRHGR